MNTAYIYLLNSRSENGRTGTIATTNVDAFALIETLTKIWKTDRETPVTIKNKTSAYILTGGQNLSLIEFNAADDDTVAKRANGMMKEFEASATILLDTPEELGFGSSAK